MPDRRQFSFVPLSNFARFRRRTYIFAVTALAVFLWGFAISRAIPDHFTATATIETNSPDDSGNMTKEPAAVVAATLRRDLASEEHVTAALKSVGATDVIGTGINELNSEHLMQLVDVRRNLQIEAVVGRKDDDLQIAVSYTNANAARAALVVNQLVRDYANRVGGNGQAPESPDYDRAHQAVEAARQKATAARTALSQFIARQRDKKQPAAPVVENTVEPAAPATQPNEALANLTKQLRELAEKRLELLTKLTEAHPEVKQLEWQMSELEQQIAVAAQIAEAPAPPPSIKGPGAEPPASVQNWLSPEEAEQYARLAKTVDEAQEQLDAALKQERAAWDEQVRAAAAAGPTVLFASVPSQPNSPLRQLVLVGSAVLAIAAGLAMAIFAAGIHPMFVSVAQAQAALPVPIVGAITTTEKHPASARRGSVPLPLRFATFACELSLALWLIAAVSLSLADRQFGSKMIHDPAGAMSDAISRFLS